MNKIGTEQMETDRLRLRRFTTDDAPDMFFNWANDELVTKYLTWKPHESVEHTASLLATWIQNYSDGTFFNWAIEYKSEGKVIGNISVVRLNEAASSAEIGYCMSRFYWGRGIMTEALVAVMDYLFDRADMRRVSARHDKRNIASGRVMQKAGMRFEGELLQSGVSNAGIGDLVCYALLKSERDDIRSAKSSGNDLSAVNYQDVNAATIDRWAEEGWEWGKPITHEEFEKAKLGEAQIFLTPTKPVPSSWLGNVKGKRVLGLASGGGQQMPILTALGARCTVFDYSKKQLESEKLVAEREGYDIDIVRGDMTKRLPFDNETFDIIVHPVSNCYVKEVKPIWKECCRVLKKGGRLLAGTDHFVNYIVDDSETRIVNKLPFDPLDSEEQRKQLERSDCGVQFSHTIEEQIGGQLEAGFTLLSVYEDTNGEGRLHDLDIPTFLATLAEKR